MENRQLERAADTVKNEVGEIISDLVNTINELESEKEKLEIEVENLQDKILGLEAQLDEANNRYE